MFTEPTSIPTSFSNHFSRRHCSGTSRPKGVVVWWTHQRRRSNTHGRTAGCCGGGGMHMILLGFIMGWIIVWNCYDTNTTVSSVVVHGAPSSSSSSSQQRHKRQSSRSNQKIDPKDYYAVLGLKKKCTPKQIKSKYRNLALQYHPDKFKSDDDVEKEAAEEKFIQISQAYAVLSDEKQRSIYDLYGAAGLEAYERGQDPAAAGFGNYNGFHQHGGGHGRHQFHSSGSSGGGGGGQGNFGGFDAFKIFEEMFGRAAAGGGGASFGQGGGSSQQQFRFSTNGGFAGGGGGQGVPFGSGSRGTGGRQQQQRQHHHRPPVVQDVFTKDIPGISKLGSPNFPNPTSKYFWLIVFYDSKDSASSSAAKGILDTIISKSTPSSSSFKIGAMDCNKNSVEQRFCQQRNISNLPQYAFVVNGLINTYPTTNSPSAIPAKDIYNFCMEQIQSQTDTYVYNINHPTQLVDRLLLHHVVSTNTTTSTTTTQKTKSSPFSNHPNVSFLLLTDKYETSSMYISIAYQYRRYGKDHHHHHHPPSIKMGISRAKNLKIAQLIGTIQKYPTMIALVPIGYGDTTIQLPPLSSTTTTTTTDDHHHDHVLKVDIIQCCDTTNPSMKQHNQRNDITTWMDSVLTRMETKERQRTIHTTTSNQKEHDRRHRQRRPSSTEL
jgi:curved DNA-binding protein CbpA